MKILETIWWGIRDTLDNAAKGFVLVVALALMASPFVLALIGIWHEDWRFVATAALFIFPAVGAREILDEL